MRDGNRLKEKIELQLDRRQVTSLSVVALLLSAGVFALGVMVGKNLAPQARVGPPAEALLDRLDAQADGGMVAPADPLTFQDELTKKFPSASQPPAKAAHQPLPAAPVPPPSPANPVAQTSAVAAATADAGSGKPLVLVDVMKEVVKDVVKDADKDSGIEVAVATKLSAAKAAPAPKSFFTLQVRATQSSAEADKFAKKLRGQGFQSLVAEADVSGKGKWYRVRVGHFDTRAQADHYLGDFKRETRLEAFVTAAGH